jgi:hypothetical protein
VKLQNIQKANLYFIIPIDQLLDLEPHGKEDSFLQLIEHVERDEFTEDFCQHVHRRIFFSGQVKYKHYSIDTRIYLSNFTNYDSSVVYIKLLIEDFHLEDYACLINADYVLSDCYIGDLTLNQYMVAQDIVLGKYIFLLNQVIETAPSFPSDYEEGLKFVKENEQIFHQFLVRSDTHYEDLRIDNHRDNLESIANFYGTIDYVSPVTLLQIYQKPIRSLADPSLAIDVDHRACWWLTLTDILFIQRVILLNVLKSINDMHDHSKKHVVKKLALLDRILFKMNGFWHFDDLSHEISKKVVNKVKERVGMERLLDKVQMRIAVIENATLREINEEQNEQNHLLNMVLLLLAGMQILPLVYQIIQYIHDGKAITLEQALIWMQTFSIAIVIPILVWKGRALTKIMATRKKKPGDLNRLIK